MTCCPRSPAGCRACGHLLPSSVERPPGSQSCGEHEAPRATYLCPTVDSGCGGQQGSWYLGGWAQRGCKGCRRHPDIRVLLKPSSNRTLLGNGRQEGRKVSSFFTHKSYWGARGVAQWYLCAGIGKALASTPSTAKVHQKKMSQVYRHCRHHRLQGLQFIPDLKFSTKFTEHHGRHTRADPGTSESSRPGLLGKSLCLCLSVTGPTAVRSGLGSAPTPRWSGESEVTCRVRSGLGYSGSSVPTEHCVLPLNSGRILWGFKAT